MPNIKVVRLHDSIYGDGGHSFSVVASDSSARYVFPSGQEPFDGNERINKIIDFRGGTKPTSVEGWLSVALSNLDSYAAEDYAPEQPYKSVKDAVNSEQKALEEKSSGSSGLGRAEQRMNIAADNMLADPEIEAFSYGQLDSMSDDSEKAFIASMIDAAGTRDLNPWLEPWLAGDTENMDFSKGLVLNRFNLNYDYKEPATKEEK